MGLKEPLGEWSDETIENVVRAFIDEKFPTVLALNKIDHPDADKVCPPASDQCGKPLLTTYALNRTSAKLLKYMIPKPSCSAPQYRKYFFEG